MMVKYELTIFGSLILLRMSGKMLIFKVHSKRVKLKLHSKRVKWKTTLETSQEYKLHSKRVKKIQGRLLLLDTHTVQLNGMVISSLVSNVVSGSMYVFGGYDGNYRADFHEFDISRRR